MEPLITLLAKIRIPRTIAAIVVVFSIGFSVYIIGLILFNSLKTIATLYPKYELRFTEIYMVIAETFNLPYDVHLNLFENLWGHLNVRVKVQNFALSFSESFLSLLGNVFMVIFLIVFLLVEIGHFKDRAELAFEKSFQGGIRNIMTAMVKHITRYLSIKFFLSLATGVVVGISFLIIGMDFPVVWGFVVFILNFIPTIGSIIAGLGALLFAIVQFYPNPVPIVSVMIVVTAANMVIGNILEPKIQGDNLGLSPFVILLSLLGWGWLWGFAGLILAVPMTVIVKIIFEHIPSLQPVSIMMGSYKAVKKRGGKGDLSGSR